MILEITILVQIFLIIWLIRKIIQRKHEGPAPPNLPPNRVMSLEEQAMMQRGELVLSVKNLKKYFPVKAGIRGAMKRGSAKYVHAVEDVSFNLYKGEVVDIVGESGCGKTTTGRLLTLLETPTSGYVIFEGKNIRNLKTKEIKNFRKNVQMVFQDPYESLNPRLTVYDTVAEPLIVQKIGKTREERVEMVAKALEYAELKPANEYMYRFPHELSGGQRQRVAIARTLVINPRFIVADEPVSMLDVSIRAGVMNLMLNLRDEFHVPIMFITHDVSVARYISDRIMVMYLGNLVEMGKTDEVIFNPLHPYTKALLSAVPIPDPTKKREHVEIKGDLPSPIDVPTGCSFHPRCIYAQPICSQQIPQHIEVTPGHSVNCHFAGKV